MKHAEDVKNTIDFVGKSQRKKRQEDLEILEQLEAYWLTLSRYSTAPKTLRLPEPVIFRLERVARELDTSSGKLVTDLLEEILPFFEQSGLPVKPLQTVKEYWFRKKSNKLEHVDLEQLRSEVEAASNPHKQSPPPPPPKSLVMTRQ